MGNFRHHSILNGFLKVFNVPPPREINDERLICTSVGIWGKMPEVDVVGEQGI